MNIELRDWFAGMAMQGIVANSTDKHGIDTCGLSYKIADAMMEARKPAPSKSHEEQMQEAMDVIARDFGGDVNAFVQSTKPKS